MVAILIIIPTAIGKTRTSLCLFIVLAPFSISFDRKALIRQVLILTFSELGYMTHKNPTRPLEYSEKLKTTVCSNNNPSDKFLKWIAKKCSCGKSDSNNTPAFRSCYWRLP